MITGEYPPQPGGVSDYSRALACGLAAAGDAVEVYAPAVAGADPDDEKVAIHRLPGRFGPRALAELSRRIPGGGDRLLVQYVPHSFGLKAMNLPFCLWLHAHARRNGGATVIFHEVSLGFRRGDPARYRFLDAVTKLMALIVTRSAARIFVTASAWEPLVRRYARAGQPIVWLPVPSTIPIAADRAQIAAARCRYVSGPGPLVGHFSAHPRPVAALLRGIIPRVLEENPAVAMLLIGANGEPLRNALAAQYPQHAARVRATGALAPAGLSAAIAACDLMLQPYPDGVTSRRTSMMAALSHGCAIVTSQGPLTEAMWSGRGATMLGPAADTDGFAAAAGELIRDADRRHRLEKAAAALYQERFDLSRTIRALRERQCA
jgi:glycosyltransferase involved in cell wall biosynthesis